MFTHARAFVPELSGNAPYLAARTAVREESRDFDPRVIRQFRDFAHYRAYRLGLPGSAPTVRDWLPQKHARQRWAEDTRDRETVRIIALHEAGHAAVAYALAGEIESVSVIADDDLQGSVRHFAPSGLTSSERESYYALVAAGGVAAEYVFYGYNAGLDRSDEQRLREAAARCAARGCETNWINAVCSSAIRTVGQHRIAVDALADRLLQGGELDGAAAENVLRTWW